MSLTLQQSLSQHLDGVVRLDTLGVIRAAGEEAVKFLQGQLTQDVALMGDSDARLAAFCTAKGRMLANFVMFRRGPDEVLLVCGRDILAPTLKRLQMFVLRARVRLSDASEAMPVYGLAGPTLQALVARLGSTSLKIDVGAASLVFLAPAGTVPRALWVTDAAEPAPEGPALSAELWLWGNVHSGIAPITPPTVEAFVPQMLNYESVGGVNFKKGCYPGQEVVARSQFRGTLKRRGYLVHGDEAMAPGQEIFHTGDAHQPCGTVALAASSPLGGFDGIVSMQTAAATSGELHLGAAGGPALGLLPLPYPLLDDI